MRALLVRFSQPEIILGRVSLNVKERDGKKKIPGKSRGPKIL
jgi:hypothetical protein